MNSSGEQFSLKTRKPYTITKQRERWTEEEHNKFLDALRKYRRAWQRIEEHIGTKTAVQIRSHAQKFFTKLEKESLTKGVPPGHAHDIYIPPPRPKRKPSNPYPRKNNVCVLSHSLAAKDGNTMASVSSQFPSPQAQDLENEPPPGAPPETETSRRAKETSKDGNSLEAINTFKECPSNILPARKLPVNNLVTTNGSCLTSESKENEEYCKIGGGDMDKRSIPRHDIVVTGMNTNEVQQEDKLTALSVESQKAQKFPGHPSVDVGDGSSEKCTYSSFSEKTNPVFISHPVDSHMPPTTGQYVSGRSPIHPFFPLRPPFTLFCNNQEPGQTVLNLSTFSNLILSTLLQNPAIYAAAAMAASFWPCRDDSATDTHIGGCPGRHSGPSPSLAAIVGSTVAAASAWWAALGLLHFCPPIHTGFAFPYATTSGFPMTGVTQASSGHNGLTNFVPQCAESKDEPTLDPQSSTPLKKHAIDARSSKCSSSDSEESGGVRLVATEKKASSQGQTLVQCPGIPDADKAKTRKPLDRSSCGSNTTSSSETEQDALEMQDDKEESKEVELSLPGGEPINRRCRNLGTYTDTWKEVSEEGRLAFQALFSREVLPQSFSPPYDMRNQAHPKRVDLEENQKSNSFEVDLGRNRTCMTSHDILQSIQKSEALACSDSEKVLLTNILAGHGKLKSCRTGFKPYKRCSMEGEASNGTSKNDEGSKRIRLEGNAST